MKLTAVTAKQFLSACDCDKNEIPKHCCEVDNKFSQDQKKVADRESTLITRKIRENIHSLKNPNHIFKSKFPTYFLKYAFPIYGSF